MVVFWVVFFEQTILSDKQPKMCVHTHQTIPTFKQWVSPPFIATLVARSVKNSKDDYH